MTDIITTIMKDADARLYNELIAHGDDHSMCITSAGLFAWGKNGTGQLGLGDTEHRLSPVRVPIENVIGVAGGTFHTMILTTSGLFAYGKNRLGQLGLGDKVDKPRPVRVPLTLGHEKKVEEMEMDQCAMCYNSAFHSDERQPRFKFCGTRCYEKFLSRVPWQSVYQ